ncbi:MAG: hypothetical protein SF028_15805 [Candidatus Sumerlaeia bacterium]|nr:hypothetical protein [Candidatus Sumerlaeia bacterium]
MSHSDERFAKPAPATPAAAAARVVPLCGAAGLLLFTAAFFLGDPGIGGWDQNFYFAYAGALAEHGDLDLAPAYQALVERGADPAVFDPSKRTATGQVYNYFPIGHPLTHAWALLPGRLASLLAGQGGGAFSPLAQYFYCLSCVAGGLLGLAAMRRIVARWFGDAAAALALLSLFGASMLGYYLFILPAMSHSTTLLVLGAALWLAVPILDRREEARSWRYFALGLLVGWGVAVRLQDVGLGWLLAAAAWAAWRSGAPVAKAAKRAGLAVLGGFLGFLPQLLHWRWRDGAWLPSGYSDYAHFDFSDPHFVEVLFHARHGLFHWHPLLLAAAAGFVWWMATAGRPLPRRLGAFLALHAATIWILAAGFSIWWFGDSFGSRPFLSALPLFWLGLAALWSRALERPRAAWALGAAIAALTLWNALLMVAFHLAWISRSGPLEPAAVLRAWVDRAG